MASMKSPDLAEGWTTEINADSALFDIDLRQVYDYRYLLFLFVRRDFVASYKQTLLGPLWQVVHPLLTTLTFTLIFARVAKIPTDGLPAPVFYLSGLCLWNYFANCVNRTSVVLTANAGIFGKVYFPRLVLPVAAILSSFIAFFIQLTLLLGVSVLFYGVWPSIFSMIVYLPIVTFLLGLLALGSGLIIASVSVRLRDFQLLLVFGLQLLMYATPIIYPLSFVPEKWHWAMRINPLSNIVEAFRCISFTQSSVDWMGLTYSALLAFVLAFVGVLAFNRAEKTAVDIL